MHSRTVVVLGSLCLISLGRSALAVSFEVRPEASADSMPPIEDWVVFTDDLSDPYHFGCDQVSIRDDRDLSQGVLTGAFSQSPSQLGVAPSGRFIMALDEGQSGWAHVLTGDPTSKATWKTQFFQGEFTYGADVEVTLDSQFALFGYDHGLAKINVDKFSRGTQEPQSIGGNRSGRKTLPNGPRPQRLPPLDGFLPDVLPASIVLAPDGHTAYVASIDAKVYQIDIDSMQIINAPIAYEPSPQAPRRRYYDTYATISPSGRFLIIGVGLSQQLNVMDLALRTSQLVPIPGAGVINAVKFSYAPLANANLAVHGGSSVSVIAFDESQPYSLTVAAKTNVPAKSIGLCEELGPGCADIWRAPALAWSHNGDIVFAAIGPIAYDWAAITFRAVGSETVVDKSYFRSCEMPVSNGRQRVSIPNDIFTFNLTLGKNVNPSELKHDNKFSFRSQFYSF